MVKLQGKRTLIQSEAKNKTWALCTNIRLHNLGSQQIIYSKHLNQWAKERIPPKHTFPKGNRIFVFVFFQMESTNKD